MLLPLFLSESSPFTSHVRPFRIPRGGWKDSKESFVLQKESKGSFVSPMLNKIIKMDVSICPPPPRLVPVSGSPQQEREAKKTQGNRIGSFDQSFKSCLLPEREL